MLSWAIMPVIDAFGNFSMSLFTFRINMKYVYMLLRIWVYFQLQCQCWHLTWFYFIYTLFFLTHIWKLNLSTLFLFWIFYICSLFTKFECCKTGNACTLGFSCLNCKQAARKLPGSWHLKDTLALISTTSWNFPQVRQSAGTAFAVKVLHAMSPDSSLTWC